MSGDNNESRIKWFMTWTLSDVFTNKEHSAVPSFSLVLAMLYVICKL